MKISLKSTAISLNNASKCLELNNVPYKIYCNFISFKKHLTFVLFKTSANNTNHINISKIKSQEDIDIACDTVKSLLGVDILSVKIDNIVSTTNLKRNLNLSDIVSSNRFSEVKYNPEQFPGLFLTLDRGSAILFHSGKVVIVGCKTNKDVEWVATEIIAKLETY